MAEFRAHHVVSELLELLGIGEDGRDRYTKILTESSEHHPPVGAVTAKGVISRHAGGGSEQFLQQYDDLKAARCRELDPLVYVLSKVAENPSLATMVATYPDDDSMMRPPRREGQPGAQPGPTKATITDDEMAKLRADLAAATSRATKPGGGESKAGGMATRAAARSKPTVTDANYPALPAWAKSRPLLTADFPAVDRPAQSPGISIGALPREMQELAVVDDLLSLLVGVEGKFLTLTTVDGDKGAGSAVGSASSMGPPGAPLGLANVPSRIKFDQTLDPSLAELVTRVVPICTAYSTIAAFTDGRTGYTCGSVRQALCAAIRSLLKEYLIVVAQLETQFRKGNLSIQKLLLYIQPFMRTMTMLAKVANDIHRAGLTAGGLLSYLHERVLSSMGDTRSQELILHLAQAASVPFFTILEGWIYRGVIDDPYSEFMVEEEKGLRKDRVQQHYNDLYWNRRYMLVSSRTPSFLMKMSDKILRTGKYLNVVRESGKIPECPAAVDLMYQLRDRVYVETVDQTFSYSSMVLLDMLNTDFRLMDRLTSLKNYFCMGCGDFFAHFLDSAESELTKNIRNIVPSRLDALLEMALRVSTASQDPFKDDLRCSLVPHTLITELFRILNVTHDPTSGGSGGGFVNPAEMTLDGPDSMAASTLTGLEAFTFEYEVRFPLSLIISRKSLKRYQLLFRHLLHCRHVERTLGRTWLDDQRHKQDRGVSGSWQILAFALRQRMMNFVQSFQYYISFEVIEPNWHIMAGKLSGASTIDDVLGIHDNFLDTCLKECMLTSPSSLKTISKLLSVCTIFSNSMKRMANDSYVPRTPRGSRQVSDLNVRKFEATIKQFDDKFTTLMHSLMHSLKEFAAHAGEQHMSNMVDRLDFNEYYSTAIKHPTCASSQNGAASSSPP